MMGFRGNYIRVFENNKKVEIIIKKPITNITERINNGVIFSAILSSKVSLFSITNRYLFFNFLKKRYFEFLAIKHCKYHKNILIFAVLF